MTEPLSNTHLTCVSSDNDYPHDTSVRLDYPLDSTQRRLTLDEIERTLSFCQIEDFKVIESTERFKLYFKKRNDHDFFRFSFKAAADQLIKFGYEFNPGRTDQELRQLEQDMNALAQSLKQSGVFKTSLSIEERTLIIYMAKDDFFDYQELIKAQASDRKIPTHRHAVPTLVASTHSQILRR